MYLNGDIAAGTSLNISNVGSVYLAQDVDLTAAGGALNIYSNVSDIFLTGAAGTNTIENTSDNTVHLTAITATASNNPSLTVSSGGQVILAAVDVHSGTLHVTADSNDTGATGLQLNGTVQAGPITIEDGGQANATATTLSVANSITSASGGITITVDALVTSAAITANSAGDITVTTDCD